MLSWRFCLNVAFWTNNWLHEAESVWETESVGENNMSAKGTTFLQTQELMELFKCFTSEVET